MVLCENCLCKRKVRTVLECDRCGFRLERKFTKGDYIFKHTGAKCCSSVDNFVLIAPPCKGEMVITEIWTPTKELSKQEKELREKW